MLDRPDAPHDDASTFAVPPSTSVRLPGLGDDSDILVADWSPGTLIDLGRRLKIAIRRMEEVEEHARRAAHALAAHAQATPETEGGAEDCSLGDDAAERATPARGAEPTGRRARASGRRPTRTPGP